MSLSPKNKTTSDVDTVITFCKVFRELCFKKIIHLFRRVDITDNYDVYNDFFFHFLFFTMEDGREKSLLFWFWFVFKWLVSRLIDVMFRPLTVPALQGKLKKEHTICWVPHRAGKQYRERQELKLFLCSVFSLSTMEPVLQLMLYSIHAFYTLLI